VWVKGRMLLNNYQLTTIDVNAVLLDVKTWQSKIQSL
jgi:hypothetical protein